MSVKILQGDCLTVLKTLPDNSVDAIVTDPPYGISFMGKHWDYNVPKVEVWQEALRVLKHGGHALIACGTRTQHRMAVNIEDAGFEIRDIVGWIYGSGFPKSRNITLDMDKMEGHPNRGHRIAVANRHHPDGTLEPDGEILPAYEPKSDNAKQWNGYGTALKPAMELWTLARKPLSEPTVAANVLKWGTGGINVDGCRVEPTVDVSGWSKTGSKESENRSMSGKNYDREAKPDNPTGRFPANLIHDGSDEVVTGFPSTGKSQGGKSGHTGAFSGGWKEEYYGDKLPGYGDSGSAARFFYAAKASKAERNAGLEGFEEKQPDEGRKEGNPGGDNPRNRGVNKKQNHHPTVKPIALMRYLCRLITPPQGTILDCFAGSGSTGIAAKLEGFDFIGIEREAEYCRIAEARIGSWKPDAQEVLAL